MLKDPIARHSRLTNNDFGVARVRTLARVPLTHPDVQQPRLLNKVTGENEVM